MLDAIFAPHSGAIFITIDLLVYTPETPLSGPLSAVTPKLTGRVLLPPGSDPAVLFVRWSGAVARHRLFFTPAIG